MPKTKISEFSATPANNTDIDSINIAEGCAPSGINDAIRELMAQLKDFQTGAVGDSFNGPVGTTTAAAGAFTTLSSTGNTTLGDASGDSVTINGTATFANANPTLSAGTANGVAYLNGSKVVTSGSALTFDGTNIALKVSNGTQGFVLGVGGEAMIASDASTYYYGSGWGGAPAVNFQFGSTGTTYQRWLAGGSEQMRLTSTGLGIGTSSPQSTYKLTLSGTDSVFPAVYLDNTTNSKAYSMRVTGTSWIIRDNTAGTDRLNLDSSGNLGLGVSPNAWNNSVKALQVNNAALASFTSGGNVQTWLANNAYYDNATGWLYKNSSVGAALYAQSFNGSHNWNTAPSGTAGNAITFTQALTLNTNGALVLQGGNTSASGVGVAFPATQSASTDANTLDDYEEGTFTPTALGGTSSGTTTYTVQQGTYTKIGNQVTISVRLGWTALTGTGELLLGGFPFTSANNSMEYMGAAMSDTLNWGGGTYLQFYKNPNTAFGVLFYITDDASWGVQQCTNETAAVRFTVTYFV